MLKPVKIHKAVDSDLIEYAKLVVGMFGEYAEKEHFTLNTESLAKDFFDFVKSDDKCVFVARDDSNIVGTLAGYLEGTITDRDIKWGWASVYYVKPDSRSPRVAIELLDRFEAWSKEKGAKAIIMGALKNVRGDALGKLFERRGYALYDMSYIKEVRK